MNLTANQIERFWSKVDKTDACWEWTACKDADGYGFFRIGKQLKAHRVSWMVHFGEIPEGLFVCHHCDNPSCVRPDHLFLGTVQENNRDRVRKNRSAQGPTHGKFTRPDRRLCGEKNPRARLSAQQVSDLRERHAKGGIGYRRLAKELGIPASTVYFALSGRSWGVVA